MNYALTRAGNARNGQQTGWPTCFRQGDYEFQIITRIDWHPVIWRRPIGFGEAGWESYDLSGTVLGLVDVTDSHRCLSMAVDGKGRVHVLGNVHSQVLKYVRSTPGSITSWTSKAMPTWWGTGAYATYMKFECFADGTLLLIGKAATVNNAWTGATPQRIALLPPDADEWIPCRSTGGVVMNATAPEDQELSVDAIPDWTYSVHTFVDAADVLHCTFVWRVDYASGNTMTEPMYARSRDKGATWENVLGEPLTVPFTYRDSLDGASGVGAARVTYGATGNSFPLVTNGGMCIDADGHPHFCGQYQSVLYHSYWDGSTWVMQDLNAEGWEFDAGANAPSCSLYRGEVWLWGRRRGFLCGAPWNDKDRIVWIGQVGVGTPDGVYDFESSCFYQPMPIHGGGGSCTRLAVPNGDSPRIFSIGDGPRTMTG